MMDPIAAHEHKGYTIEIYYDPDPPNPREEFDTAGVMTLFHSKYALGDKHGDLSTPQELQEYVERDGIVSFPIYLYDHGGLTISTEPFGCPWDSGQIGYIYADSQDSEYKDYSIEQIEKLLLNDVVEYDYYLRGDVYGYVIKDSEGEKIDTCWGFFGSEYVTDNAIQTVQWFIEFENNDSI